MSFNFGNTGSTFGTPAAKPTGFGAPLSFGTPATAAPGFGGFGSSFGGGAQQQQPAFGSTFGQQPAAGATAPAFGSTFGQPANTTPAFGSTFGAPATSAPAFGSTFGAPATSAPAFGSTTFGAPASTAPAFGSTFGAGSTGAPAFGSTFGAVASTTPSLFGAAAAKPNLFGTTTTNTGLFGAPTTSAPTLFGASATTQAPTLFGAPAANTTSTPNLFGTTTSTPSLFGSTFGATAATTASGLFGSGGTTTFGLGATATTNTGFNLFGGGITTSAPSLFSGLGKTTTTASGFTGFGSTFTGFGAAATTATAPTWSTTFGVKPPTGIPAGPALQTQIQQTLSSIYSINIFGDERDNILKKWNMLQACWGTGKGFYNPTQAPVEYDSSNPFFRCKSIGYVVIPGQDNSHGLVKLIFNKKENELSNQKETLSNGILGVLGNKPNLIVTIVHIKATSDNETEVVFYVSEKGVTGASRKIPALDLCAFLNQQVQKQQLTNVGVTLITACVTPTKSQLQEYLNNPPPGIESQMWQTANANNPNPRKFMPLVLNGFSDLKRRMLYEQQETDIYKGYLDKVSNEITEVKKKHANSVAKINELKQKYSELHHRLLRVIIKQEVTRKVGMALQPEEEMLRGRFESIISQINLPTQFKGQIHEIKCNMNQMGVPDLLDNERYKMNTKVQEDMKQFLKMEQNGISHLINIINADLKNLKIISEGLEKLNNK